MIFSLDVRRARKGDCLLLHYRYEGRAGPGPDRRRPGAGLRAASSSRACEQIRKARSLDKQTPLPVDLLMVSHVDDDHIQGILELTREMLRQPAQSRRSCSVLSLWHNSFDDIIGKDPKELTGAVTASFGAASLDGGLPDELSRRIGFHPRIHEVRASHSLKVLASIEQGHQPA